MFSSMLKVFALGAISTIPAQILEQLCGASLQQETFWISLAMSFLLIGPIEEGFKLLAVWLGAYRGPAFKEPLDGIRYAVTAALGFAGIENLVYVGHLGPGVLLMRAFYATPAHILFAAMWGYSLGLARFRRNDEFMTVVKGYAIASALHGSYNALVAMNPKAAPISLVPLIVFMVWLARKKIHNFKGNFPFPSFGDVIVTACPSCGAYNSETSETCERCGFPVFPLEPDAPRFCGRCRARLPRDSRQCSRCLKDKRTWGPTRLINVAVNAIKKT